MKWKVHVTEIINEKLWMRDDEVEFEEDYSKFYNHNIDAETGMEAVNKVKEMWEGKKWYYISTNEETSPRNYKSHHIFNDELYEEANKKWG